MRTVAIIGGKLQGTEAAYLAKKAGIRSLLIDKNPLAPASLLCDEFLCCDVRKKEKKLLEALDRADFILPANENEELLAVTAELAAAQGRVLAFDPLAYAVTSSKRKSDRLFRENGIPAPRYYPEGDAPYMIKPSGESGSVGVMKIDTKEELSRYLQNADDLTAGDLIIEEYLEGPSYSIEVIGKPGNYRTYQITRIHMADDYDCRMVTAPCPISAGQTASFRALGMQLAEMIRLHGIMDVEVIDDGKTFKVLEIDARIPSQTPTVVYHSTGVNLLSELANLFCGDGFSGNEGKSGQAVGFCERFCAYEHFLVKVPKGSRPGSFAEQGEHIMGQGAPLSLYHEIFSADEVITDLPAVFLNSFSGENRDCPDVWRGTFINTADTFVGLEKKRAATRKALARWCGIPRK